MAVASVGSPVVGGGSAGVSSKTFNVTAVGGANNYLVVDVGYFDNSTSATASVTYNGVAMTLIGRKSTVSSAQVESYGLINPSAGTNAVVITFSASGQNVTCGAREYSGVDATTPTNNVTSDLVDNSVASSSLVVTSAVGDYAHYVDQRTYGIISGSYSCTQDVIYTSTVADPTIVGAARDATGATTVTFSATWTAAGLGGSCSLLGFNIKAASGGGDTTAPTLTSATGAQTGSTTASGSVTTNEANGTLYYVCTTSGTAPTAAQVKTGKDNAGATATYAGSQAITTTGAKTFAATGLTASTPYYWHSMHEDTSTNQSTVVSSSSFTTASAATPLFRTSPAGALSGLGSGGKFFQNPLQ